MRKSLVLFLLLLSLSPLKSQTLDGTWVMVYVKTLQPVIAVTEVDGEVLFDLDSPEDSATAYNPGLMALRVIGQDSTVSYSWEGEERWAFQRSEDQVQFFGQLDTLFGSFNSDGRLVLQSTIDDEPAEYLFEKVNDYRSAVKPLDQTSWMVSIDNHYFNGAKFSFTEREGETVITSSTKAEDQFSFYDLNWLFAIEYDFKSIFQSEIGMAYVYENDKGEVTGLFYPMTADGEAPKKRVMKLVKSSN